jgi:hypothetical protein
VRDRGEKIKVGIKYCGGCRSGYDRVALVDELRDRFAEKMEFVPADSEDAEEILVVCGCPSACAKVESSRPLYTITSPADAKKWILKKIGGI